LSENARSVTEWPVRGTPLMVYGVVRLMSDEAGLSCWDLRSNTHTTPLMGVQLPVEVFMRVPIRRKHDSIDLASLSLQLLPGERTLISIEIVPEQKTFVEPFIQYLIQRLIDLGFADEPPPPKRPLGFPLPSSQ
jgi:hypothetical protein